MGANIHMHKLQASYSIFKYVYVQKGAIFGRSYEWDQNVTGNTIQLLCYVE
jgi:hypothetical protein